MFSDVLYSIGSFGDQEVVFPLLLLEGGVMWAMCSGGGKESPKPPIEYRTSEKHV